MHPSAGYWSLCRGIWELLLQYSQYSVWREAESEGTWRARLRVGTCPSVCTGVIIRLGGNNIRIVYATHTTNIKKRHCLYSEKNITAAMIHHLSSGHMFSWSPDLVEINWPIRSVWDSSLCKHWEKKKNYAFTSYGKDWIVWTRCICSIYYSVYFIFKQK